MFNIGELYVTPTTYPHLMLEDVRSLKHPCICGPILVHQQVDFASFNYFASTLISHDQRLRSILAFGTDGDKALIEAFSHTFPFALRFRCFIHFKKNIKEKEESAHLVYQHVCPISFLQTYLDNITVLVIGNASLTAAVSMSLMIC